MKTILTVLSIAFAGITAQAQVADQMFEIINCRPTLTRPDLGMSVSIEQGGIAGITQLTVKRFFLGHSNSQTFVVKQVGGQNNEGAAMVFTGKGVRFSVNFTTTPRQDGGHDGKLSTLQADGKYADESLTCSSVAHIMGGNSQEQM